MNDAPGYEEHNRRVKRENRLHAIGRDLEGAIEAAGEALAEMGLTSDEAGEFIAESLVAAEWSVYFDEDES